MEMLHDASQILIPNLISRFHSVNLKNKLRRRMKCVLKVTCCRMPRKNISTFSLTEKAKYESRKFIGLGQNLLGLYYLLCKISVTLKSIIGKSETSI